MADIIPSYRRGAVQPIECYKAGFALIKDRYWLFVGITTAGVLIGSLVPMGIIMGPMMCGLYLVYFERMRGRNIEFSLLFKGFDYFVNSLIATLLLMVPMLLVMVPFFAAFFAGMFSILPHGGGNPPDRATITAVIGGLCLLVLALTLVATLIGVLFSFSYPLIVDRRLSGVDAVKMSAKAALANVWGLLGLALLNALLGLVGALFCYVGAFLVMPVSFGALAMAYQQVFGLAPDLPPVSPSPAAPPPVL